MSEMMSAPTRQNQRGAGKYSLCTLCNNNTGSWYVPAYVEWAKQAQLHIELSHTKSDVGFDIEPLPVIKQIIVMFASACGDSLLDAAPALRKFVLSPEERGMPTEVRVFAYLLSPLSNSSRQSGISALLNLDTPASPQIFAEIAFPPLGYLLHPTGTVPRDPRPFDISFMANAEFGERRRLHLPLPILEVNSILPSDFRSLGEIETAFRGAPNRGRSMP